MISRFSALAIAAAYQLRFYPTNTKNITRYRQELYDFLYVNDFQPWLMNEAKNSMIIIGKTLSGFIMGLHTCESQYSVTQNWTWADRYKLGQDNLRKLAECLIRERYNKNDFSEEEALFVSAMQTALELDGYIYRDGTLLSPDGSIIQEKQDVDILLNLMSSTSLEDTRTLKHHLELSATNYQGSQWDDSISNSRKYLEEILCQVANRHSLVKNNEQIPENKKTYPREIREYLYRAGMIDLKEREVLEKVYSLLSAKGGHAYIADRDQASSQS